MYRWIQNTIYICINIYIVKGSTNQYHVTLVTQKRNMNPKRGGSVVLWTSLNDQIKSVIF